MEDEEYKLNLCNGKVVNLNEEVKRRKKELSRHIFNTPFEPFLKELDNILDEALRAVKSNKENLSFNEWAVIKTENTIKIIESDNENFNLYFAEINDNVFIPKGIILNSLKNDYISNGLNYTVRVISKEDSRYYLNKWKELRDVKLWIASYIKKDVDEVTVILNNNDEFIKQIPFTIDDNMCDAFIGHWIEEELEVNKENLYKLLDLYKRNIITLKEFTTNKGYIKWSIALILSLMQEHNIKETLSNYLVIYKCLDSYGFIDDEQKQAWENAGKNDNAQKSYIKAFVTSLKKKGIAIK